MIPKVAIIGGGAAGFFLALTLKERCPQVEVTVFEKSRHVLAKVAISGGGRCNCTNSFEGVRDLSEVYPRGHRLLKRLFKTFGPRDAFQWFERHGVRLVTQDDNCVFPASQDAQTIINCFLAEARRHQVHLMTESRIESLSQLEGFDYIAVTTGGMPRSGFLTDIPIVKPVPSLFTFAIDDAKLHDLMGTVVTHATTSIPGTKLKGEGPLLITHWGMSGPSILKLSSHAARLLADNNYHMPLAVNWIADNDATALNELERIMAQYPQKQITTIRPFDLPTRLWSYLTQKVLGERAQNRWQHLNRKEVNRLANTLCNDSYQIAGRAAFKDEFVTCGGVELSAVHSQTLECKTHPRLYFAGEVLDIDGITGGFNFQAAWTTAYTVAQAIANDIHSHNC
jgi:predicted Rossmann fold flavoprotein